MTLLTQQGQTIKHILECIRSSAFAAVFFPLVFYRYCGLGPCPGFIVRGR